MVTPRQVLSARGRRGPAAPGPGVPACVPLPRQREPGTGTVERGCVGQRVSRAVPAGAAAAASPAPLALWGTQARPGAPACSPALLPQPGPALVALGPPLVLTAQPAAPACPPDPRSSGMPVALPGRRKQQSAAAPLHGAEPRRRPSPAAGRGQRLLNWSCCPQRPGQGRTSHGTRLGGAAAHSPAPPRAEGGAPALTSTRGEVSVGVRVSRGSCPTAPWRGEQRSPRPTAPARPTFDGASGDDALGRAPVAARDDAGLVEVGP